MMLGIRTVVGRTESQPVKANLTEEDMNQTIKLRFPGRGNDTERTMEEQIMTWHAGTSHVVEMR